jgi:hypothetical protein
LRDFREEFEERYYSWKQGMKRVMRDAPKLVVKQSRASRGKRRDFGFLTWRPPLPKKGKSGQSSGQF